ncbi:MAG: S8 family peptidase, partial [candidate division Zixibacteria bacterium]|nr:S8 family peptidase [candidate division Zixibacteria bacterium]
DQGRPLQTTLSDIIEAFQWALNPDGDTSTTDDVPDVILNSWGVPKGLFAPCDETFTQIVDVVEAAGIVTIFAAGNEGPDPMSLRSPADQASTPTNSLAVGAVNMDKDIASFSSRGPSSCDQTQIKPELVAPGVSVRSSQKGGGYTYMSGTSMAAPYIAGLVVLMRQYSPDATVEEIKQALLQATEDLGATGEDNIYGNGLVDASRLLALLPLPVSPSFKITSTQVSDDGIAWPGEEFGLDILINNPAGNIAEVIGVLETGTAGVVVMSDSATYLFGVGGSSALSMAPYQIRYDSGFHHGHTVDFVLYLQTPEGGSLDTIAFVGTVGVPPSGHIADHSSSRIGFSVSDFAQFGFGTGSLYNAGGKGLRVDGSDNLLYEAGIVLGRNALQLSSSIRDAQGRYQVSDYEPTVDLSTSTIDEEGGLHVTAGYADSRSEIPIPIELTQETISYVDDGGFIIFRFQMRNMTPGWLTGLHFGFLTDFDLDIAGDQVVYDDGAALMYQTGGDGPLVGLVSLKNLDSFKSLDNGAAKRGFSRADKFDLIALDATQHDPGLTGDLMMFLNSGSFAIQGWDSNEVAFAVVIGTDLAELYENAQHARERFDLATAVDEGHQSSLPTAVTLHQNYPNPFNPTTTISFSLSTASDVSLVVYNALGQKVSQLVDGRLPAGSHEVLWNATNASGGRIASGVYFYRLSTSQTSHSRKMLLLK